MNAVWITAWCKAQFGLGPDTISCIGFWAEVYRLWSQWDSNGINWAFPWGVM